MTVGSPAFGKGEMVQVNKAQRALRRSEVWRMRTSEGWSQTRIADELGVTQGTISRDLKHMAERVYARIDDLVEQTKREQLAILWGVVDELLQQWRQSKGPRKVMTQREDIIQGECTEVLPGGELGDDLETLQLTRQMPGRKTTTLQEFTQLGDHRYITEMRAALADIRLILGANAPVKSEVEISGKPIEIREVVVNIPHEIAKEYGLLKGRDNGGGGD